MSRFPYLRLFGNSLKPFLNSNKKSPHHLKSKWRVFLQSKDREIGNDFPWFGFKNQAKFRPFFFSLISFHSHRNKQFWPERVPKLQIFFPLWIFFQYYKTYGRSWIFLRSEQTIVFFLRSKSSGIELSWKIDPEFSIFQISAKYFFPSKRRGSDSVHVREIFL